MKKYCPSIPDPGYSAGACHAGECDGGQCIHFPFGFMAGDRAAKVGGVPAAIDPSGVIGTILFKLRLPRAILLLLVGAALSGSGAAYQGLFRNPLADPFLIGVSSGAGLGAVVAMTIHWPYTTIGLMAIPLAAFAGCVDRGASGHPPGSAWGMLYPPQTSSWLGWQSVHLRRQSPRLL